jgi:hypothetical protein
MFVGKAGAYPIEEPLRYSTPGLAHKQQTSLESLARDKHSSLIRTFVNYGGKKFYNIGPWEVFMTLYFLCNLTNGPIGFQVRPEPTRVKLLHVLHFRVAFWP